MANNDVFMLQLMDYSCPSYTTFSKRYFGTLSDISDFVSSLKNDDEMEDGFNNLIATFEEYSKGNTSVLFTVAYTKVPFLTATELLGSYSHKLDNYKWTHLNTWRWEYFMRFREADLEHIWLSLNETYIRAIRGKFKDLQYSAIEDEWQDIGSVFWGFPHTIEANKPFVYNRFFVVEKTFDSKAEALEDFNSFSKKLDINFSEICNDIFGDG